MSLFDDVDDLPYQSPEDTFRATLHETHNEFRAAVVAIADAWDAEDVGHEHVMRVLTVALGLPTQSEVDAQADGFLDHLHSLDPDELDELRRRLA